MSGTHLAVITPAAPDPEPMREALRGLANDMAEALGEQVGEALAELNADLRVAIRRGDEETVARMRLLHPNDEAVVITLTKKLEHAVLEASSARTRAASAARDAETARKEAKEAREAASDAQRNQRATAGRLAALEQQLAGLAAFHAQQQADTVAAMETALTRMAAQMMPRPAELSAPGVTIEGVLATDEIRVGEPAHGAELVQP